MKRREKLTEAAVRRCSSKQFFLKMSQYSQENLCWSLFLIKFQTRRHAALKRDSNAGVFIFVIIAKFLTKAFL